MQELHPVPAPVFGILPDPGPGDLQGRPHADAESPAVERVAASVCQEDRIHAQCRRVPENGADIGRIDHVLQHRDPAGPVPVIAGLSIDPAQQLTGIPQRRPAHGAQDPARQGIAGEPGEQLIGARVNRDLRFAFSDPRQDPRGLSPDVPVLHQEGDGPASRIQGAENDLGALRNKEAPVRLIITFQLYLGQLCKNIQRRILQPRNLYQTQHRPSGNLSACF